MRYQTQRRAIEGKDTFVEPKHESSHSFSGKVNKAEQVGIGLERRNNQGGFISLGNTKDQIRKLNAKAAVLKVSLARPDLSLHQRRVKEDLLRKACATGERLVQMLVDNYNGAPIVDRDVQGDKVNATDRLYPVRVKRIKRFTLTK